MPRYSSRLLFVNLYCGNPDRIHVVSRFRRTFSALGARQQVLLKRRKLGFVIHHAKVIPLQIVIVRHDLMGDGGAGILDIPLLFGFGCIRLAELGRHAEC